MLVTFRRAFNLIGRDNRGRWVALVIGAVVTSAVEMFGAVLVFVLLALVVDPSGQVEIPVVGDLRALAGPTVDESFLLRLAAAMGAFFLVRFVVQVGYSYVKQRLAHNAGARLASTLADGYLRMPYAFHLRRSSAELVRNAQQTVDTLVLNVFLGLIQVLAEAVLVAGMLLVMVVIAPLATLLAVVVLGPVVLLLLRVVQPRLKQLGATAQEMRRDSLANLQQSLYGVRDIKVLGRESFFSHRYRATRGRLAHALYIRGTAMELPRLVIETALIAFLLVFFAVGVVTDAGSGQLLSTLGLFGYAGMRIQPSLQKLMNGLQNVRFESQAIDDVHRDLRLVEEFEDPDPTPVHFERELAIRHASFAYEGTKEPVLHEVDVTIRKGEVIGICGPTGGGKTTLTDLIVGLLHPTSGSVTVDGRDLREHHAGWQRNLGIVPQMVFLIDDSLRRNIALGTADDDVEEDALHRAVERAQLGEFVARLPEGLDTVVGERGVRVSGGQRQRVAIARALYHRPSVLVFDEGTSALDTATETVLMATLERLRGEHTIVLVAHRLSTVRNCDRILYLEDGRVEAEGTFEELRRSSPGFRALADGT